MRTVSKIKVAIGLLTLAVLVGFCSRQQTGVDQNPPTQFSSAAQRDAWTNQLRTESSERPKVHFHSFGHVLAVGGKFPVRDLSPATVANWLKSHNPMFGLPPDAELEVQTGSAERLSPATSAAPAVARPSDNKSFDPRPRSLVFQVKVKGIPFIGLPIRVDVDPTSNFIKSVVNGFSPATRGFATVTALSEAAAWAAMERAANSKITHISAAQTWFDPDWAAYRKVGTKELHWRLEGIDQNGLRRYAYVRSSDEQISYLNSNTVTFQLRQKHYDSASNLYWDSGPPPQECTPGPSCTQDNLNDSRALRSAFDKVVDLWHRLSSVNTTLSWDSHQWPYIADPDSPYAGPSKPPLDNNGQTILVTLGTSGCNSFPCRDSGYYKFPHDWLQPNDYALVGHEYGHGILTALKHMRDTPGDPSPAAQFTETMADLIGIISNYQMGLDGNPVAYQFQVGQIRWRMNASTGAWDYDVNDIAVWQLKTGRCANAKNAIRDRLGHAFYKTFRDAQITAGDPVGRTNASGQLVFDPIHISLFRAWWLVIFTLFRDTPDFPTHEDLFAQANFSSIAFVRHEAIVQMSLQRVMTDLHIDTLAELPRNDAGKEPVTCP